MARRPRLRLTAAEVRAAKTPGRLNDGDGLYLQVSGTGAKSWIYMFRWQGKLKEMGLGSADSVKLADAREAAALARKKVKDGVNPIVDRKLSARPAGAAQTFGAFATAMIDEWAPGWKTAKQKLNWQYSIDHYAQALADVPIGEVSTDHVLDVLRPIWNAKGSTAGRVRERLEKVIDAAKARKQFAGENPARWKGHLALLLPKLKALTRGHQKALPYSELPAFWVQLEALQSTSADALRFLILNASRTVEVIGAKREEFDLGARVWTIPKGRIKSNRVHRVPLSNEAMAIVQKYWPLTSRPESYLFAGGAKDGHLSNMALAMCLRGLVDGGATVHGFRSTFRDWVGDETDFPREVAEAALSHRVGDKAEQAYRRGDALEKRRQLMQTWAIYATMPLSPSDDQ